MAYNHTSSTTNKEQRQIYDVKRYMSYVNPGDKHTDFTAFIDGKIRQFSDEMGERFNKRVLAKKIGISYEMLKKIINQSKKTRQRDCIIAICIALGMSHFDTNKALELYSMATLNPNRPRDMVIIEAVYNSKGIQDVNEYLQKAGCSCLSIGSKKQQGSNDNEYYYPNPKYTIIGTEVYVYDFFAASRDKSLKDMYDPARFSYKATMYWRIPRNGAIRLLSMIYIVCFNSLMLASLNYLIIIFRSINAPTLNCTDTLLNSST